MPRHLCRTVAPAKGAGGSSGRQGVAALRVAEIGRTFVCYPGAFGSGSDAKEQAAIVAVDDQGQRIGQPIAISERAYMTGCALAWSGESLLAAWRDFSYTPGTSKYSAVRARIVKVR